ERARRLLRGAVREQCGVARPVEERPRVVRHAAVDGHVRGRLTPPLDNADPVEREAGRADERPSRLEHDPRPWEVVEPPGAVELGEQRADELARGGGGASWVSTWTPTPPPTSTTAGVNPSWARPSAATPGSQSIVIRAPP